MVDPLSLDIRHQASILCLRLPSTLLTREPLSYLQKASTGELATSDVLPTLSRALAIPSCTIPVVQAFRPLLIDLTARWLDDESIEELLRLEALALLLEIQEEIFP